MQELIKVGRHMPLSRSSLLRVKVTTMIVDPAYNALYAELHANASYGMSGINLVPEIILYVMDAVSTGKITRHAPLKILDYGCGQSCTLDAIGRLLTPLWTDSVIPIDTRKMMESIQDNLNKLMETKNPSSLSPTNDRFIKSYRYDPAIKEYSQLPEGPFDFVICTDVMEHIPNISDVKKGGKSVVDCVIEKLGTLSLNHYINISTRLASQLLPDGQNAHCTVLPSEVWFEKFKRHMGLPTFEVHSRDLTVCSFVTNEPSPAAHQITPELKDRYGSLTPKAWPQSHG